ncbi:MAG: membrane protein insertase YidC [Planctomycetota bacterium]
MDKRLLQALALCLLIVFGWQMLFPPPPPTTAATTPTPVPSTAGEAPAPPTAPDDPGASTTPSQPPLGTVIAGVEEPDLVLDFGEPGKPGGYRAVFTNRGGALAELRTAQYFDQVKLDERERGDPEHWVRLLVPIDTGSEKTASMILRASPSALDLARGRLENVLWSRRVLGATESPAGVEFTYAPGSGVAFVKRFLFPPGEDRIDVEIEIRNDAFEGSSGPYELILTPAACMPAGSGDTWYSEPQAMSCVGEKGSVPEATAQTIDEKGGELTGPFAADAPVSFVGVFNKYFAVLLHGADKDSQAALIGSSWRRLQDAEFARQHPDQADVAWRQIVADAQLRFILPDRGASRTFRYAVYAGPKDQKRLEAAWPDHEKIIQHDLGMFSGIASVLLWILNFLESITKNWGVAIILLTITVRALLFPINRRSQTAMSRYQTKMKRLQPKIEEIKKRYSKDPAAQRQEQAKLMQEEGAFPPLGGCLPMFMQIPVFIGLFAALRASFDLRHAPFALWIQDLSLPDQLLRIGLSLPLVGTIEYLNVLPPLMVVLWVWQQKGMPTPADEQAARMQKMMMWMPVMMGFFLYNYAAGLSLYMITQSGLGIIEQKVIKKFWPLDETEQPRKKSAFFAKLMQAQEEQRKKRDRGNPRR